jgi:hypothetical protein
MLSLRARELLRVEDEHRNKLLHVFVGEGLHITYQQTPQQRAGMSSVEFQKGCCDDNLCFTSTALQKM